MQDTDSIYTNNMRTLEQLGRAEIERRWGQ